MLRLVGTTSGGLEDGVGKSIVMDSSVGVSPCESSGSVRLAFSGRIWVIALTGEEGFASNVVLGLAGWSRSNAGVDSPATDVLVGRGVFSPILTTSGVSNCNAVLGVVVTIANVCVVIFVNRPLGTC